MEGKLQCHSPLMSVAQALAPCWNQMHNHIFESSQLEGLYIGELLYLSLPLAQSTEPPLGILIICITRLLSTIRVKYDKGIWPLWAYLLFKYQHYLSFCKQTPPHSVSWKEENSSFANTDLQIIVMLHELKQKLIDRELIRTCCRA